MNGFKEIYMVALLNVLISLSNPYVFMELEANANAKLPVESLDKTEDGLSAFPER